MGITHRVTWPSVLLNLFSGYRAMVNSVKSYIRCFSLNCRGHHQLWCFFCLLSPTDYVEDNALGLLYCFPHVQLFHKYFFLLLYASQYITKYGKTLSIVEAKTCSTSIDKTDHGLIA